ncbi:hypothetical protein ONZ51_g9028 [Trametes cubensis]|uniref:Uncharacterized protein n=1 Tax=Trametes cubensis TaxID=1111947 RepID=A0AAD7TMB3_9APHY|nr:hypothetical protein ONZ51_g9028 [Trametes cubensis]
MIPGKTLLGAGPCMHASIINRMASGEEPGAQEGPGNQNGTALPILYRAPGTVPQQYMMHGQDWQSSSHLSVWSLPTTTSHIIPTPHRPPHRQPQLQPPPSIGSEDSAHGRHVDERAAGRHALTALVMRRAMRAYGRDAQIQNTPNP